VLTSLSLRGNDIGAAGAASVSSALEHNSVLTSLDLLGNDIGAAGAASVISALERNSILTYLDLRHNSIGNAGEISINALLKRNITRPVRRLALLSLMDEDYNREEGVLRLTNVLDLVFQSEYIISRMYDYV